MGETVIENDILFQTHSCECGWAGDEDELVNGAGLITDEVEEKVGPEEIDITEFMFCPVCYGDAEEIQ
jgi:hypothetical protein